MDSILGNRDRHWGNWGYMVPDNEIGSYKPAPIYDNGASLYPGVLKVIDKFIDPNTRKDFISTRVYTVLACLLQVEKPDRNYRSNYFEVIGSNNFDNIFEEVYTCIKMIGWETINNVIVDIVDNLDIDFNLKIFYIFIILMRYRVITCREDFDKCYDEINNLLFSEGDV